MSTNSFAFLASFPSLASISDIVLQPNNPNTASAPIPTQLSEALPSA